MGVYVCYCGGNISDAVDVEKVCDQVRKVPGVVVARANMFMCSDPGQELIIEDLKSGLVDRVVVASCSPSLHETTFRQALARAGANPYVYEHANLREQVSWVHHGAEATDKATRLVAAAAAKAGMLQPLDAHPGRGPPAGRGDRRRRGRPQNCSGAGRERPAGGPRGKKPFPGRTGGAVGSPGPLWRTASEVISELAGAVLDIRPLPFTPAPRWRALRAISAISPSMWCRSPPKARPMPERLAKAEPFRQGPGGVCALCGGHPRSHPRKPRKS